MSNLCFQNQIEGKGMCEDRLIKRKGIFYFVEIKDTKMKEMIENNLFVKPITIPGFNEKLFSFLEIQEWIENLKRERMP